MVVRSVLLALAVGIGVGGGGVTTGGGSGSSHAHSHRGSESSSHHHRSGSGGSGSSSSSGSHGATPTGPAGGGSSGPPPTRVGPPTGGGPAPYIPGGPVALFTVTSPVAPGEHVQYLDESYDTTTGAVILSTTWQGRESSFPSPGLYPVTLTVTDTYGRQATDTIDVLVAQGSASAPAGKPSAFFLATSPVAVGQTVTYTDESYDMDAQAQIVDEIWTGREASFAEPGTYPVSLKVEDSTGVWSPTFTRDVVVTSPGPPSSGSGAPPPPAVLWTASVAPNPVRPGAQITVTASASGALYGTPDLEVPQALQATWGGISYASTNASGPMDPTGTETFTRQLTVPTAADFPVGTYDLTVIPPTGQPITVALVVQFASQYVEPVTRGM